jgi:hypothetical protein
MHPMSDSGGERGTSRGRNRPDQTAEREIATTAIEAEAERAYEHERAYEKAFGVS